MQNIAIHEKIILVIITSLIFLSYVVGFTFSENSAGGAIVDFEHTKRNILAFKNNSFFNNFYIFFYHKRFTNFSKFRGRIIINYQSTLSS